MNEEIWKDIPGHEGYYQVSDMGNVKSLVRNYFLKRNNCLAIKKEKIIKNTTTYDGYRAVTFTLNNTRKLYKVHQLVAMAFLNHMPDRTQKIVVDHIDNDKSNNKLSNLQLITQRQNASKDRKNTTSKYTGVCWEKFTNKWVAHITINGKNKKIGRFEKEIEASNAYNEILKSLN